MENTGLFIYTVLIEFKGKHNAVSRFPFANKSDADNYFVDKAKKFNAAEKPIVEDYDYAYYENSTVIMKQEDIFVPDSLITNILRYASQKDLLPF